MADFLEEITEKTAFDFIAKNNPGLLQIVRTFINHELTPDDIIEICVAKTGHSRDRLAFIGCAASWIIRQRSRDFYLS